MSMKLTARQINAFEEIGRDRAAIDATLKVSMNYHANQSNELLKRERALWEDLAEIHGFDVNDGWTLRTVDASTTIVPLKEAQN